MAEIDYRSCFGAGSTNDDAVVVQKRMLTVPKVDTLDDLIRELRTVFDSDQVNIERVQDLMSSYKSNPREWIKFAHFDPYRYTRNLVDEGNGRYNLMILAWAEGQGSSIHDHANSHCFMKVLDGTLNEVRFAWPQEEGEGEMKKTGETLLNTNDVTYINERNSSNVRHLSVTESSYDHRSVFQLGHMIRCQSGCDPFLYKRYGCFCGFKGSGRPVDFIDRCCLNHDWCYSRLGCPPFMLYALRYAWLCRRPGHAQCEGGEYTNIVFDRCALRLCECDRAFAKCVSKTTCPQRKAICWSNPLIAVTNLLALLR